TSDWSDIRRIYVSIYQNKPLTCTAYMSDLHAWKNDATQNLLPNGSFEACSSNNLPDYWGTNHFGLQTDEWVANLSSWHTRWQVDNTTSHSGSQSLKIVGPASLLQASQELVPISCFVYRAASELNTAYTLSVWMKSNQASQPVTMLMRWSNGSASQQVNVGNTWQRYSLNFTPAASPIYCLFDNIGNGTLWIDDVQIERGTYATPYKASVLDQSILSAQWVHRTPRQVLDYPIVPGNDTVQVSIDANGRFLVDGQPYMSIAVRWDLPSATVAQKLASTGFNTVVMYVKPSYSLSQLTTALDTLKANGLKAIVWIASIFSATPQATHDATVTQVQWVVSNLSYHPAVIAWYVADEPLNLNPHNTYAFAQDYYNAAKQSDPSRPSFINYVSYPGSQTGDIGSMDFYCIPDSGSNMKSSAQVYSPSILESKAGSMVTYCAGKPLWFWLQSHGNACDISREPTGPEIECSTYLTLIHGIRGINYFTNIPKNEEAWGTLRMLAQEIRQLTPVLYSSETPPVVSVSDPHIHALGKTYQSQRYVIAVNELPSQVNTGITVSGGGITATVLFENRQVNIINGVINDTFAAYQRHIYLIL
ncbi:MAG: hypothetical protein PHT33_14620, partial [bacterium]|nr:hypothetical protein [bacterium]